MLRTLFRRVRAYLSSLLARVRAAPDDSPEGVERRAWRVLRLLLLCLCLGAFVRVAWVSDDAYIAFRAMDNFDHGFGLVSNVGERVQGFTNPLWILLLTPVHAITHNAYFTAIEVSLVVSLLAAALLIFKVPVRPVDGLVVGLVLPFSRAFTDYSTSGLENPLIHLLLVLFLIGYFRATPKRSTAFLLSLLASLAVATRMDSVLLVAPALVHYAIWSRRPKLLPFMALGTLPLVLWEAFSLLYYGFPFPNTAYAKLNVKIPGGELMMQGLGYLQDSLARDPLTLLVIAFALVSALFSRKSRAIVPMLGVLLYLAYVVKVGGDFMSGRFLTGCLVVALAVLAAWVLPALPPRWVQGIAGIAVLIVLLAPYNPLKPAVEGCAVPDHGITDERSCYYESTGLLHNVHHGEKGWGFEQHKYWQEGVKKKQGTETVYADTLIGLGGYSAGPHVHIVDKAALTDPLLARIPYRVEHDWRVGHFYRAVPEGYLETLRTGENKIVSPCLHAYYDKLRPVIRGPIFSAARFKAIWQLNVGTWDYLLSPECTAP